MKLKVMTLVVMLGIVGRVDAGTSFFVAGEILADCESENISRQNNCVYYLASVIDTLTSASELADQIGELRFPKLICTTPNVTTDQLRKIFITFLNDRPEHLHGTASSEAQFAFVKAFPCTR